MSTLCLRNCQRLIKCTICLTFGAAKKCRDSTMQINGQGRLQGIVTACARNRKVLLVIVLLLIVVLYMWPSWLTARIRPRYKVHPLDKCINEKLDNFQSAALEFDAIQYHSPLQEGENFYPAYIGNGKFGLSVNSENGIYLLLNRSHTLPVQFFPIVDVNIEGHEKKEAYVIDLKSGLVQRIQCFRKAPSACVSIVTQVYAHRRRPSILVQELRIQNPSPESTTVVDLHQIGASDWKGVLTQITPVKTNQAGKTMEYLVSAGKVPIAGSASEFVMLGTASSRLPETIPIKEDSTVKYRVVTAVEYSSSTSQTGNSGLRKQMAQQAADSLTSALNIDGKKLRVEHTRIWNQMWQSGFSISYSMAPGMLNGPQINTTMYYVLSNVPASIHETGMTAFSKLELDNLLHFPDKCYTGHNTIQLPGSSLWARCNNELDVSRLASSWLITLEKQGCGSMVKAGTDGVLQAMILSFGALKFSNDHLEFGMMPKDLHRDYYFRRINYGNNTHVNISVIVGDDNKAVLFASLDRNDKVYFACDAGCLDPPVQLGKELTKFPVKQTEPFTAILYITADRQHMDDLKHVIHVKEIGEAPAHEHHVMALHRHGHAFGGLPTFFWMSIAFLIFTFHLFLFKMVINEYCQGGRSAAGRNRGYNM
ncbi:uncharacterized protein KIAA2013 homolog [Lingula anatina]|uniref:Uncharacterized protein KIAA2013 homolog n=1 Tax=Lingula anatina TaxID=7574 RepID=A0A1S3JK11_LINAN|nr:uncharacterized protein KIAA2013 homolog [Lingula anatina]|eukprot:XP_013410708.1 uncharacterized protein KIAA2013 homolog [Lingula anatina]